MLIRFVVSNYLSFRKETEFNMLTGNFRIHKKHVYKREEIDLLKSAAIYGANGAGKSNFVKSIDYLKCLVLDGAKVFKTNGKRHKPFKLDEDYISKPTCFEIEFLFKKNAFAFGIEFTEKRIIEEWLYKIKPTEEDELIYYRKTNPKGKINIELNKKYRGSLKDEVRVEVYEEEIVKPNQPFISVIKDKKYKEIADTYTWFKEKLHIVYPKSKWGLLIHSISQDQKFKKFTNNILNKTDTGVFEITTEIIQEDKFFTVDESDLKKEFLNDLDKDEGIIFSRDGINEYFISLEAEGKLKVEQLKSIHINNDGTPIDFEIHEESDGTQRLIDLIPAFQETLNITDTVYIIDEIDRSMHPSMIKQMLEIYLSNPNSKGQLIFTTHESCLLDLKIFRQDEIWFIEKDKSGQSHMYSLSVFKPRYDLDIRKGYLHGRFGAIPFLGNLHDLNWD